MARDEGMIFIETSAKDGTHVLRAFELLVNSIIESPMIKEVSLEERKKRIAS